MSNASEQLRQIKAGVFLDALPSKSIWKMFTEYVHIYFRKNIETKVVSLLTERSNITAESVNKVKSKYAKKKFAVAFPKHALYCSSSNKYKHVIWLEKSLKNDIMFNM
ncbi:hypothetical protein AN396_11675 [Candidatus Epulonipiscium fishelsonii]|uniref:Uncharacterized protein n=1 Tax=Candidatus Epulonipiscium fishelsonii TaxID=77094 RepID=A0ACC8X7X2_9FIRM|nr:hypothetical protein AN396_11675 [Epulopiscium sp. SCG-B11WGA-EpuloA1]